MKQRPRIDYTSKDYTSLREALLELALERLPEWTDHSPNDFGVLLVELFAYMGDILLYYQDRIANESYLETAVERRSIVNMLRLIGCELRPPRPASADLTLVFEANAGDTVKIPKGYTFETERQPNREAIRFQFIRDDLTLSVPKTVGGEGRVVRSLPVVQVDSKQENEIVGSSDGRAGQRFALTSVPVIDDTLEIHVDDERMPWQRVDTLLHSFSGDAHFVLRRDEHGVAWIEFGDGRYGRIPPRGHDNIKATYLVGGGSKGNVPPRSITEQITNPKIDGIKAVYNELDAAGGADAESIEEAVMRGPWLFRAGKRAVTAQDYEAFAREFGVGKVFVWAPSWNRVALTIAPAGGGCPSDTYKEDLRAFLDDKRMVTTMIEIRDPKYVNIDVGGTLAVEPYFSVDEVKQRATNIVRELLAFENVDFRASLYLSKVYEAIEAIEGVAHVHIGRFARSGSDSDLPQTGTLTFGPTEIPRAAPEGVVLELEHAEPHAH